LVFSGNERPAPLSEPPQAQLEKHFHDWFAAIERYPRQVHEM
jgi:hypothetical protein